MTTAATSSITSGTLGVPGARLYYEVRGSGPMVVLVGAPMGAAAFLPVADLLAGDYTVLTTDPRGVGRSPVDDLDQDSTPELRAADLSSILRHLNAGPAAVFGSSGGAVTALALLQAHPDQVRTVIAHEPPLEELLEDREHRRAATDEMIATYLSEGPAAAWALFFAEANIEMPADDGPPAGPPGLPEQESAEQGALDHGAVDHMAVERDPQEIADEHHFFVHELRPTTFWRPDLALLGSRAGSIVVGIGEDSAGQVCDLTSNALATALGIEPAMFPGGHIGFVDDPEAFVTGLRAVLGSSWANS